LPPVVRWAKVLVDSGNAAHTQGVSIAPAGDGSGAFLVTGSAWTDTGEREYGLVVKMNPSGGILDHATFFDIFHENGIYGIKPTYNASQVFDGYIAAGFKEVSHKAPGEDTWWHAPDAWLMKLDASLNRVWESTFGMQGGDWANAILQNNTGYLYGGALRDIGAAPQGGWLFQTDGTGNGLWSKSLYYYCSREDEKDDVLHDPCPEPNISSGADLEVVEVIHSLLPTLDGGCIAGDHKMMQKFDATGNRVWMASGPASAVIETGGGFLGAGVVTTGLDSPAIGLTRVSAAGDVLWTAHYGENASGPSWLPSTPSRGGVGVVETADGSYILAGHVDLFDAGSPNLWLLKTLPGTEGQLDWALPIQGMNLHSARPLMAANDGDLIVVGSMVCDGTPRLVVLKVGVSGLRAPSAAFTLSPGAPYCLDQVITFNGSVSSDPDGSIVSYEWDFGDGTTGVGAECSHRYALSGDYTVTLKVTDNDGIPVFARQSVTVGLPGVIWERTYANGPACLNQDNCRRGVRSYDIIKGVDGGFVISGRSDFHYSEGSGRYDSWLLKTFDNGIVHWEKNLTNDPDLIEEGTGLTVTPDHGYAIAGTSVPYASDINEADIRTMLIKTDSRGNPVWRRIYTDYAGAEEDEPSRTVLSLDNGGFVVGGHRWQDGSTDSAMWLLWTDAQGMEIPGAGRLFPPQAGTNDDAFCLHMAPAFPDGFVLTGRDTFYDWVPVLKTDTAGNLSWAFHWPPTSSWHKNQGNWVAAVADGYVVAGQYGVYMGHAALMKVKADGTESAWVTRVPFTSHERSGAVDGAITPDGGIVIVGWIQEPTTESPSKMFVAKFTGEGVHQWHQVFQDNANYAWGTGVLALEDGSVLVLGDECRYSGHYGCRSRLRKIGPQGGPVAAFDMNVRGGASPLEVRFSDLTSSGGAPYTYAWDFENDGTVDSTDQNPVHTYTSRGTYSVRLEVTDNAGSSDTFVCEDCIRVLSPGFYVMDADGDGDVDGQDLAVLAAQGAAISSEQVKAMAENFGLTE
jgi:PKD repeat protein